LHTRRQSSVAAQQLVRGGGIDNDNNNDNDNDIDERPVLFCNAKVLRARNTLALGHIDTCLLNIV
jgi:hypothetical protein